MKRLLIGIPLLLATVLLATGGRAAEPDSVAAQRMRRYNVIWTRLSQDATGVMPLGNIL